MDATQAMSRVLAQYVGLSVQGENLRQMMVAGAKIPCDVWTAYANARQDYMVKSQEVFDQLSAKGITVEQVIYSGGKPVVDPSNPTRIRTLQVQAPLRPPAFVGLNAQCPGLPLMAGGMHGSMGWEPLPIGLGFLPVAAAGAAVAACTAATLGACLILVGAGAVILGIAGYAGYKIMQQVAVAIREYESSPAKTVAAYTACYAGLVKGGMAPTDAGNRCSNSQASAQKYATDRGAPAAGLGFWGWLGVGAGALIVGTIVFKFVRGRVGAATRLIAPLPVGGGIALDEFYPRPQRRRRGR